MPNTTGQGAFVPAGNCQCDLCAEMEALYIETGAIDAAVYIPIFDETNGCARTTLANLLASNSDSVTNTIAGNRIAVHTDVAGNAVEIFETVTTLVPAANGSFVYTNESGVPVTYTPPTPVSVVNSIDLRPTGNPNEFTVEITYTDDNGNTVVTTDTTPVTIASAPDYLTCDGTALLPTDRIVLAPTTFADGHAANQNVAGECLTRADIFYNLGRRSITGGENYLNNGGNGYGSFIGNGVNNNIDASYSAIAAGNGNDIIAGSYHFIGGGLQNRVRSSSYSAISGGYQNDVTGPYHEVSGYRNVTTGYGNRIGGYRNNVTMNRSIIHGDGSTGAGTMNALFGYAHRNVAGSYNALSGYNHTNTNGTYNTLMGLRNINTAGNYTTAGGTGNRNTAGSGNSMFGGAHINTAGSYNFMGGYRNRADGNYNAALGYTNYIDGVGNMVFGYNNRTNANYSVTLGRNLTNNTQDGIMIANSFQRLGFFGVQPVPRPTLNSATATTAQIVVALETLGLVA